MRDGRKLSDVSIQLQQMDADEYNMIDYQDLSEFTIWYPMRRLIDREDLGRICGDLANLRAQMFMNIGERGVKRNVWTLSVPVASAPVPLSNSVIRDIITHRIQSCSFVAGCSMFIIGIHNASRQSGCL